MEIFNEVEWNQFRKDHPELRFWQAMAAYLYVGRILIEYRDDEEVVYEDTFYWQDDEVVRNDEDSKRGRHYRSTL